MGWQSYVLPYRDEEHKKLILKIIKEHNEADWDEVERGEELYSIVDAAMTNTNTKGSDASCVVTEVGVATLSSGLKTTKLKRMAMAGSHLNSYQRKHGLKSHLTTWRHWRIEDWEQI